MPVIRNFFIKEMRFKKGMDEKKVSVGQYEKVLYVWYDWLRINNPDAGARAAKVRAECMMHSHNVVVFIGVLAAHVAVYCGRLNIAFIILVTLLVVASLWATAHMRRTFQRAVLQQFYCVKTSKIDAKLN